MKTNEQIVQESKQQLAEREYRAMKIWMEVMATRPQSQTIGENA